MLEYNSIVRRESASFLAAAQRGVMSDPVPSCPDWNLAALVWHLTEVQSFWANIVGELLISPVDVVDLQRPADSALLELFASQSERLVEALTKRNAGDVCWSWNNAGRTVGWTRRRQAHEALIHRIDAELTIQDLSAVDPELAADGIDEMLSNFAGLSLPEWASFSDDGITAVLESTDVRRVWGLQFGRFTGTSPTTDITYDLDAMVLTDPPARPSLRMAGGAAAVDLWLWGRGDQVTFETAGDEQLVDRIRDIAAESTL